MDQPSIMETEPSRSGETTVSPKGDTPRATGQAGFVDASAQLLKEVEELTRQLAAKAQMLQTEIGKGKLQAGPRSGAATSVFEAVKELFSLVTAKPVAVQVNDKRLGLVLDLDSSAMVDLKPFLQENAQFFEGPPRAHKILIVEDDQLTRTLLRQILASNRSYEIVEARNGKLALSMIEAGLVPDLFIMDVMMPEMSGLELLQKIRADERFHSTEVIICSCVTDRNVIKRAASMQVDFVVKPFSPEVVREKVKTALVRASERMARKAEVMRVYRARVTEANAELRKELQNAKNDAAKERFAVFKAAIDGIDDRVIEKTMGTAETAIKVGDVTAALSAFDSLERETDRIEAALTSLQRGQPHNGGRTLAPEEEAKTLCEVGR